MFSNSTKYAIRAIVQIMETADTGKSTVADLAAELDIPQAYLSKILQQLAKSGVISSTKGRGGGFYLTKDNLNRPLIDIVVCIDGQNVFDQCILGLSKCSDKDPCALHPQFKEFKKGLENSICVESVKDLLFSAEV
jgi:Rrf2 family iron-sulfur cluster assembly transcriptional regulator